MVIDQFWLCAKSHYRAKSMWVSFVCIADWHAWSKKRMISNNFLLTMHNGLSLGYINCYRIQPTINIQFLQNYKKSCNRKRIFKTKGCHYNIIMVARSSFYQESSIIIKISLACLGVFLSIFLHRCVSLLSHYINGNFMKF